MFFFYLKDSLYLLKISLFKLLKPNYKYFLVKKTYFILYNIAEVDFISFI